MQWLNYHHLYYFLVIVQEGGVAAAARKLHLTHSTLSAQLRALEAHFGLPLFERRGKRLVLTPFGVDAASYAADIFRLGSELSDVAQGRASPGREVLRAGVVAGLPKTLVHRLLGPALDSLPRGVLSVQQDAASALVESLVAGRLHLVIADEVPAALPGMRIHAHALGETEILWYVGTRLARSLKGRFPACLERAPLLLPPSKAALRRRIDAWLVERGLSVEVRAEIEDAGVLRAFGSAGRGVFPVRAALRTEVEDLRGVTKLGPCVGVRERYFLLSTERRIRHPAIAALVEQAKSGLLAPVGEPRND